MKMRKVGKFCSGLYFLDPFRLSITRRTNVEWQARNLNAVRLPPSLKPGLLRRLTLTRGSALSHAAGPSRRKRRIRRAWERDYDVKSRQQTSNGGKCRTLCGRRRQNGRTNENQGSRLR